MDHTEFESYFNVYSDNSIITMQILTSDIMEILIDFRKKQGIYFDVVIKDSTIYIRFWTQPMFEPKVAKKSLDKQLLAKEFYVLKFIIEVSKKINKVVQEVEI